MSRIIEVNELTKSYGKQKVVDAISFEVVKGEIFGILGPNGAGKTTTLEMIETMRPIDSGTAFLNGIDVAKEHNKIKSIIGVQPQTAAFEEKMKLTELLSFFASTYGRKVDALEILGEVQLKEKASEYPENLSGGQRQRFSIATALVNEPKVLFLDEPTTGLDPQSRRNLWDLIKDIRRKGVTVILTTHYMDEAEMLCDRVAIMDNGKIIALDKPKKLISDLLNRGFEKKEKVAQANLEDVFIDLTGRDLRE
jgi:ABC-2 type transport system ATP-binding protein